MAEKELDVLIKNLDPVLNEGEYVFASIHTDTFTKLPKSYLICYFKESEGISIITDKNTADTYQIPYDYTYAWIKLNVYSDLASVGLTATISNAFARHNMSCNIIAAFHHDHVFVDYKDGEKALEILEILSEQM